MPAETTPPPRFDEAGDATRRTYLANERTYLAWWRSGLTAFAVSLAVGRVVPDLADTGSRLPYSIVGAGFGLLGLAYVLYGMWRQREVDAAVRRGEWVGPHPAVMLVLAVATVLLGVATTALVAFET